MKANGKVIPNRSMRPLTVAEIHGPIEIKKREIFDELVERRRGTSINPPKPNANEDNERDFENYEDDDEDPRVIPEIEDTVDAENHLVDRQPSYDKMINASHVEPGCGDGEVYRQKKILIWTATMMVLSRKGRIGIRSVEPDGIVHGTYDDNPFASTLLYDVVLPDGQVKEYSANLVAENILSQVDDDGYSMTLMEAIVDHRKDEATAVPMSDKYLITQSGQRRLRKTTKGWKLLVRWKDGSEAWIDLKDMKESHPVETAEFAKARGISDEPAFAWWVPYTLRKRDVILSAVKSHVRRTTHKYGVEVPRSVEHASQLDKENNSTLWMDALKKEMFNVGIAFEMLDDGVAAPNGWNKVSGHLVWDVKMDLTRKARWVLDGHKTSDPVGTPAWYLERVSE